MEVPRAELEADVARLKSRVVQLENTLEDVVPRESFDTIEEALKDFKDGKFLIVVDNEDRENEGDLIVSAQKVTQEQMTFMIRHTSGMICVGMSGEILEKLELPPMVANNTDKHQTAYTVSVDAREGTTTGISAGDRTRTSNALAAADAKAADFSRPGHMFPLRARPNGVLERMGHTEASVDLCRMCGLPQAGVLSEIAKDDGTMARRDHLLKFAVVHDLKIITIADMIKYRKEHNL